MKVTVLYFGPAADDAGVESEEIELGAEGDLPVLRALLFRMHPPLAAKGKYLRFAVNREYVGADAPLSDGDEIALIPPVAGGAPDAPVFLREEPIDLPGVIALAEAPEAGAVCIFQGTVRAEGEDTETLDALDYSAYGDMALDQLRRLRADALSRFDLAEVVIVHRTGRMEIGETSVVIAVSAPHRADAFAACRFVIDELKKRVPIWKKEIRRGGGTCWVDPTEQK